jgi:trimethylamine---corrinoid protein Co-methyltransferase
MQPVLTLLGDDLVRKIIDEALMLLQNPGVKVQQPEARLLLAAAGAQVDGQKEVVRIPEKTIRAALATVPKEFTLYDQQGAPAVNYGGNRVHFDPGSSGVSVLDSNTLTHRPAVTEDLVSAIKIAETLPQYDAQSTSLVCSEIPEEIGDLYRLYLVLLYAEKPVVTGAFSSSTTGVMIDMLAIFAGGRGALAEKPTAVFDVCPTPPLVWSEFGASNLIDLARANLPAQIVAMPLAGVAAPATLLGTVVQHAAETLSGITIHQLANPGAPIVWGGAPAIMDMRQGTTPMGAIETAMIDVSYAQVGKFFDLPTHAYMGASDSKVVDAQAGMESGMTALAGGLAGINMISGAGMLNFLATVSLEKLIVDAEAIAMVQRMLQGMVVQTGPLAADMYEGIDFQANFLKQRITGELVAREHMMPSDVIDRGSVRAWEGLGSGDTFARAKSRAAKLLADYQRPDVPQGAAREMHKMVEKLAVQAGMDTLPVLDLE